MLTPIGVIAPVRVNVADARECLCLLCAQWVNVFEDGRFCATFLPSITLIDFFWCNIPANICFKIHRGGCYMSGMGK